MKLLTALALAAAVAGCAIVPYDYGYHGGYRWHGDGYRYHHYDDYRPYRY